MENFNLTLYRCGFISCPAVFKLLQQIILTTYKCLISLYETVTFSYELHVPGVRQLFWGLVPSVQMARLLNVSLRI